MERGIVVMATSVMQDLAEELFGARLHFTAEEHLSRNVFDNFSIVHEDNPVGDVAGKAHFVGHDDRSHPIYRQFTNHIEHFLNHLGVKS